MYSNPEETKHEQLLENLYKLSWRGISRTEIISLLLYFSTPLCGNTLDMLLFVVLLYF